ncbi:MAG: LysM peptidoglycan-binding domain-containing protein [Limisphaerales bacterium]
MKCLVSLLRCLPPLLLGLFLGGCIPQGQGQNDEEKEPHFLAGKSRVSMMDYPAAVESFEKALTLNPNSAAAHFELGWLFAQKVPDPAAAIYHYERFLKLRPNAPNADVVKQLILASKQEIARTVSVGPVTGKQQLDLERLAEENKRLTEENRRLAEEVAKWRANAPALARPQTNSPARITQPGLTNTQVPGLLLASATTAPPVLTAALPARDPHPAEALNRPAPGPGALAAPKPTAPAPTRVHVIKPHETLAGIARLYGVKIETLIAANPKANPRHLRPGQTLKVPPQ